MRNANIIAALLLLTGSVQAIELPEACRVKNRGGRCVLSNLATLGRVHQIAALESLAPNDIIQGPEGPFDDEVREMLNARGVHWRGRDHGSFDRTLLRLADTHGVVVSMKRGAPWLWGKSLGCNHSIILTRYQPDGVSFYCPDNPQRIWRASREWFTFWWLGNSMVFSPSQHASPANSPVARLSRP
jgi:hypothetical protein